MFDVVPLSFPKTRFYLDTTPETSHTASFALIVYASPARIATRDLLN